MTQCQEVKVRVEMRNGAGPWSYPRTRKQLHNKGTRRRASPCSRRLAGPCRSTLCGIHPYLETDITSIACRKARRSLFPCRNFDTPPHLSALSSEWMPGLFRFIVLAALAYLYFCTTYQADLSSATSLLKTICQLIPTNQP